MQLAVADEMDYWVGQGIDLFQPESSASDPEGWSRTGPEPDEPLLHSGPRHCVSCIPGESTPLMTAGHALHVLDIMNAANESINSGESASLRTSFALPGDRAES